MTGPAGARGARGRGGDSRDTIFTVAAFLARGGASLGGALPCRAQNQLYNDLPASFKVPFHERAMPSGGSNLEPSSLSCTCAAE